MIKAQSRLGQKNSGSFQIRTIQHLWFFNEKETKLDCDQWRDWKEREIGFGPVEIITWGPYYKRQTVPGIAIDLQSLGVKQDEHLGIVLWKFIVGRRFVDSVLCRRDLASVFCEEGDEGGLPPGLGIENIAPDTLVRLG